MALSPDGSFLYAGYNDIYVRKIDLSVPDVIDSLVAQRTDVRGKAIAVDNQGRVYLAEGTSIQIYDPDLAVKLGEITGLTKTEGVAATRESGQLVLYTSDRTNDNLTKWELTEAGGGGASAITAAAVGNRGVTH